MKRLIQITLLSLFFNLSYSWSTEPLWDKDFSLAGSDPKWADQVRSNIYQLPHDEWKKLSKSGKRHIFIYPVTSTELLIPIEALNSFFSDDPQGPIRQLLWKWAKDLTNYRSMDDVYKWVGVHDFPSTSQEYDEQEWPELSAEEMMHPMGATLMSKNGVKGLTFSCAACHTADLFGKKIIGLTNRFPRANEFFRLGKETTPLVGPLLFQSIFKLNAEETKMYQRSRYALKFTGVKKPQTLGLDTSLAQVGLSLSKRGTDPMAQRNILNAKFPRANPLETKRADSKPAVWWNLKYKTRWLSDGSIIQGNPIYTNFLWNEIGRGADLTSLEKWLQDNQKTIQELTSAVFATEAPRYLDFFPASTFDLKKAKAGEKIYQQSCQKCHGIYTKAWSEQDPPKDLKALTQTIRIQYHKKTPVIDVGTDPGRYLGMKYFAQRLNELKISQTMKTIVEPTKGYVPPPLVGIWARYPYFHNSSVPDLCSLLTIAKNRPKKFIQSPANDPMTDYDTDCLGYPTVSNTLDKWKKIPDYWYDTSKEGLSNQGHDLGIFIKDGVEILNHEEKRNLIEFLKSL